MQIAQATVPDGVAKVSSAASSLLAFGNCTSQSVKSFKKCQKRGAETRTCTDLGSAGNPVLLLLALLLRIRPASSSERSNVEFRQRPEFNFLHVLPPLPHRGSRRALGTWYRLLPQDFCRQIIAGSLAGLVMERGV